MKCRIITILALLAVMVALTGIASASELILLRDGVKLTEPIPVKNGDHFNIDLQVPALATQDQGVSKEITASKLACTDTKGKTNPPDPANCDFSDYNLTKLIQNFTVTSIPITTQDDSVNVDVNVPLSRQPGTQYSFEIDTGPFGDPPNPASASRRMVLLGGFITGKKCNDLDGNGICGQTEPGLAGWKIILRDENGTEVANTTTDASGNYAFKGEQIALFNSTSGLNEMIFLGFRGKFTVEEVPQAGWTQTGEPPVPPGIADVTVDATDVTVNFANHQVRSITGMKCKDDASEDGLCGAADPALPGWTIVLSKPDGTEVARTTTDANGKYEFKDLQPGTYIISEVLQNDWRQTGPKPVPPGTWTVTLVDQDATGKDFANVPIEKPCVERCKVVGWGTLGPKAAPEVTFKIFAFTDFMPEGAVDVDDSAGNHIKATKIESVVTNKNVMPMTGEITGEATFNGDPVDFTVKVTDGGDPGRAPYVGKDTFDISIPAKSYHKSGTLTSGNLQVIY